MSSAAPPGATRVDALVIGAGLAGLGAAATLRRAGLDVRVLAADTHPGGVVRSEEVAGYRVEHGPNTLRVTGAARSAFADLGLEALLVPAAPANRLRGIFHDGRIMPLPTGPGSAVASPLVSLGGKLRMLAEPFIRGGDPTGETVAEFITRRLGPEALERLVGPFLTGVYAGDERQLGAESVFASLVEAERRSGSILRGMLAARRAGSSDPPALPGIHSCEGGLGDLPARLARDLGECLALGTPVASIAQDGGGLRVEAEGSAGALWSERVILATPAAAASQLTRGLDATASAAIGSIDHAPIVVCHLGADPAEVRAAIEGFGFLVPREARLGLLGCLFLSNLFPGRAPTGRALLTCMIGGVRWPEAVNQPEDLLHERLLGDLDRTLGLREAPEVLRTVRWERAVAQPGIDHPRTVREVQDRLRRHRVEVAGSWVRGVSAGDTLASGVAAARQILGNSVS